MGAGNPAGGSGVRGGGKAGWKIPVGGVGWRVGIAGEGVCLWKPEIHW